jgi:hypothetical protein
VESLKSESGERDEEDININKRINEEFNRLFQIINNEKKAREETEEAFLDMLRSVINKMKIELENEKKERYFNKLQREKNEENLLTLLEETCNRLDAATKF